LACNVLQLIGLGCYMKAIGFICKKLGCCSPKTSSSWNPSIVTKKFTSATLNLFFCYDFETWGEHRNTIMCNFIICGVNNGYGKWFSPFVVTTTS